MSQNDPRLVLQIKLMLAEARQREADASVLQEHVGASDSGYLLRLLAFEILLKAAVRVSCGSAPPKHDYQRLWGLLPAGTQRRVLEHAADRMSTSADYSDVNAVLETLSKNFVRLRYPYEASEGLDEEAYRARGAEWIAKGSSLEDADFVYHPMELRGLTLGLEKECGAWLATQGAEAR